MRILLLHRHSPDDPSNFDWIGLVSTLSTAHTVLSTWWVVETKERLRPELQAGVLTSKEFESFAPDVLLIDGSPDLRQPAVGASARKVPWELEERFRSRGGAIIFLRAIPDFNNWDRNLGYAEYGFPLAKSQFGGAVYVACPPNDSMVRFTKWQFPRDLLGHRVGVAGVTLAEVVIERPWVLDDGPDSNRRWNLLFWVDCDVKDPVWRYEGQLENRVRKPYVVAAWTGRNAPTFLITGDAFSDGMIAEGQNELLLRLLVEAVHILKSKRELVIASRDFQSQPESHNARRDSTRAWDVFICHASEDKDSVARPLASALTGRGLRVWLDEIELEIGDHLIRRIDEGLARSRYGIVILSRIFLAKQWPQRELDALTTRELGDGAVVVLPVWHGINRSEVAAYSLPLADRVAAQTEDGIEAVVDRITRRIGER